MRVRKRSSAIRAKTRTTLYLTMIMSLGVQLASAPAFAIVTVPTGGGGTCWAWQDGTTNKWCPNVWDSSVGYMGFNFNDHTDEGCSHSMPGVTGCTIAGCDPGPGCTIANERRRDWDEGIKTAADDWDQRRAANGATLPAASPVWWSWTDYSYVMDVGFYHIRGSLGYSGRTFLYTNTIDNDEDCEPTSVYQARVFLNKLKIDGTPPWFFDSLVRHELGHVFGLCDANASSIGDNYKSSAMFVPDPSDLCSGPAYDCFSLSKTSSAANNAPWPVSPPWSATYSLTDPDYAAPNCMRNGVKVVAGIRCVYGK